MPGNNREIVNQIISELSMDFGENFTNTCNKYGLLNMRINIDFSEIESEILAALENGEEKNIGLIIDKSVASKLRTFIEKINPTIKKYYSNVLQQMVGEMSNYAMKTDKSYADRIASSIDIIKPKESSFRETLRNLGDTKEPKTISIEEALSRNAQSLYERTGNIPEGYVLNEDGKVIRDTNNEIKTDESNEKTNDGMEFGE